MFVCAGSVHCARNKISQGRLRCGNAVASLETRPARHQHTTREQQRKAENSAGLRARQSHRSRRLTKCAAAWTSSNFDSRQGTMGRGKDCITGNGMAWIPSTIALPNLRRSSKDALPLGHLTAIAGDYSNQRRTVRAVKQHRRRRRVRPGQTPCNHGSGESHQLPPPVGEEKAAQDSGDRMGLELERGDNAEISPSAAERPEEIVVFRRAGSEHFAVSSDHLRGQQIVD